MKKNFKILGGLSLILILVVFVAVGFAEEKKEQKQLVVNAENIKYVPFPNEFKKYEVYPWEILKFPEFNKVYKKILNTGANEKWLQKLNGPSSPNKMININNSKFVTIYSCKQHYCDTHLVLVLFNPVTSQSWGLLIENKKIIWLGNPNIEIKNLLKDIAKITWPELSVIKSIK